MNQDNTITVYVLIICFKVRSDVQAVVGVSSQLPQIWSTKQTPYLYSYIAKKSFLKEDDKRIEYKYQKIVINVIKCI